MTRFGLALALVLALVLVASSALAVPAPMPTDELTKRADVIVEAKVERVSCAGPALDKGEFVSIEYRSELAVTRAIKGKPPATIALSGFRLEWKKEQPTGGMPPNGPLPRGWRGKLYLNELPGGGFAPVWYNAIEEDPASSRPESLPRCGGGGCSGCALPAGSPAPGAGALIAMLAIAIAFARRGSALLSVAALLACGCGGASTAPAPKPTPVAVAPVPPETTNAEVEPFAIDLGGWDWTITLARADVRPSDGQSAEVVTPTFTLEISAWPESAAFVQTLDEHLAGWVGKRAHVLHQVDGGRGAYECVIRAGDRIDGAVLVRNAAGGDGAMCGFEIADERRADWKAALAACQSLVATRR